MGNKSKPPASAPTPPPVATTGADAGNRAVYNRNKRKKAYGFEDTLLSSSANSGFSARDLDPSG